MQALMILPLVIATVALSVAQTRPLAALGALTAQPYDPVLVGAGDIASCDDLAGAFATAKRVLGAISCHNMPDKHRDAGKSCAF
jgi:hypothetical protein